MRKLFLSVLIVLLSFTLIACDLFSSSDFKEKDLIENVSPDELENILASFEFEQDFQNIFIELDVDLNFVFQDDFLFDSNTTNTIILKGNLSTYITENFEAKISANVNYDIDTSEIAAKGYIKGDLYFVPDDEALYLDADINVKLGELDSNIKGKYKQSLLFNDFIDIPDLSEVFDEFDFDDIFEMIDFEELSALINEIDELSLYKGNDYIALKFNADMNTLDKFRDEIENIIDYDSIKDFSLEIDAIYKKNSLDIKGDLVLEVEDSENSLKLKLSFKIQTNVKQVQFPNFKDYVDMDFEDLIPNIFD